ncbi:hypothetical protein KY338_02140 [Candidatus Woesearchaeota archaeon]|nr:hypothetical protein [Candidatus Woesearchaeota archaeon]MBW3006091.1 hypothetical protein [Candidatus Woesearchaeota archaeon]
MADIHAPKPGAAPKTGMFGAKPAVPEPMAGGAGDDVTKLAARLKISEERYSELRKKLLLIEQNMLSHHKKAMNEIKVLHSEITDINSKINEIQDRILLIIKELRLTAKREDIDVMKKYVELWNPMRFVTKEQVENIVQEILDQGNTASVKREKTPKDL